MSKGRLNALFSLLLLISGAIVLLAFFTWNDPRSYETELGNQITLINIEQCDLFDKRNKVKVRGWAYVEGNPRGRYQIYAQTDDGLYRKFEAFSRERGDVIEALELNSTFRMMGFEASYRGVSSNYTGKILVHMVNPQGEVFSASYQCS